MSKFWHVLMILLFLAIPAAAQQQPIRVNCGGSVYTDSKGQAWAADFGFNGGTAEFVNASVAGTSDPQLFQHYRWNPASYSFAIPNGAYTVNLWFVENAADTQAVGVRVSDISINGALAFPALDIFAAAAGGNKALIESASVQVASGQLQISFAPHSGTIWLPKISAIEIVPAASQPTPALPAIQLQFKVTYDDGTPFAGQVSITQVNGAGFKSTYQPVTLDSTGSGSVPVAQPTSGNYTIQLLAPTGTIAQSFSTWVPIDFTAATINVVLLKATGAMSKVSITSTVVFHY